MHIRIPQIKSLDNAQHPFKRYAVRTVGPLGLARCPGCIAHRTAERRFARRLRLAGRLYYFFIMQPTRRGMTTDSDKHWLSLHFGARLLNYLHQFWTDHYHLRLAIIKYIGYLMLAQAIIDRHLNG